MARALPWRSAQPAHEQAAHRSSSASWLPLASLCLTLAEGLCPPSYEEVHTQQVPGRAPLRCSRRDSCASVAPS